MAVLSTVSKCTFCLFTKYLMLWLSLIHHTRALHTPRRARIARETQWRDFTPQNLQTQTLHPRFPPGLSTRGERDPFVSVAELHGDGEELGQR